MGTLSGRGRRNGEKKAIYPGVQKNAVRRMRDCKSVDELARELDVTRRCLYKWRAKLEAVQFDEEAARPNTRAEAQRREMLQLKRLFAEKAMEVDFLKDALQKVEARRQRSSGSGEKAFANTSES
jgi:predicted RNase H-like nuclease (RuvC/YqgF family)